MVGNIPLMFKITCKLSTVESVSVKMLIRNVASIFARNSKLLLNPTLKWQTKITNRYISFYDPDYLDSFAPEIPVNDKLLVQLKGYDYHILENFQRHINKIVEVLDIDIDDAWGLPTQKTRVQRFAPASTRVDSEYLLTTYERNLQFVDLPSKTSSILFRLILEIIPEGVTVNIIKAQPEHNEIRFVPDNELIALKQQLTDMGGPRTSMKKKK